MTDQPTSAAPPATPPPAAAASASAAAAAPAPLAGRLRSAEDRLRRGIAQVSGSTAARYQSAIIRIGFSLTWLVFLLREWPNRGGLYGPHSPWGWDLAHRLIADNHAFTVLMWSRSGAWFELVYVFAIAASVMLLLGWRTRTAALLFMIGVLSLQNRSVFMGDGGDNVVHIMAIYLAFTRCGQVWSLDARRARRAAPGPAADADPMGIVLWAFFGIVLAVVTAVGDLGTGWALIFWGVLAGQAVWWLVQRRLPGEPRIVLDMIANVVHAGAMLVVAAEVCMIYSTAGWYKIQGSRWEDGTALYYPLHLHDFTPWPALSHALAANGLMVMAISYGTVWVQVAFPFTLLNRKVKNVLLVGMMCEHAAIAVVLGLPVFSLAMITADSVFLPTAFLLWLGRRAGRLRVPERVRLPRPRAAQQPGREPVAVGAAGEAASSGSAD